VELSYSRDDLYDSEIDADSGEEGEEGGRRRVAMR
jgi:hypothetical protein